ncbi:homoserine kinase-like [Telopea speciosissima]|uniref:homoserine kinase-like n=1 Tax=Telopea speciosissima TaxID=54955 RepID=UPI001CC612B2|nr:homoserine kinase-like [Telopea speciosissima]
MAFMSLKSIIIPPISSPTTTTKAHHRRPLTRAFKSDDSLQNSYNYDRQRPLTRAFKVEPEPIFSYVKSFAPAIIADVGPDSKQINCAIDGIGDYVSVRIDPEVNPGTASISTINGVAPKDHRIKFTTEQVMESLGIDSVGLSLSIEKGLPPLWNIGSTAATAAAVFVAVNEMFGGKLSVSELIQAGVYGRPFLEEQVSDCQLIVGNLMTSIMGGFVMIHKYLPLEVSLLEFPAEKELFFIFVNPEIEIEGNSSCTTRLEMTTSMKKPTSKKKLTSYVGFGPTILRGAEWARSFEYRRPRAPLLPGFEVMHAAAAAAAEEGEAMGMGCRIIKNKRVSDVDDYLEKSMEEMEEMSKSKIPGLAKVMKVALEEGAFGCKLVGPNVIVAVTDDMEKGQEIKYRMVEAFHNHNHEGGGGGLKASATIQKLDRVGARVISSREWK